MEKSKPRMKRPPRKFEDGECVLFELATMTQLAGIVVGYGRGSYRVLTWDLGMPKGRPLVVPLLEQWMRSAEAPRLRVIDGGKRKG